MDKVNKQELRRLAELCIKGGEFNAALGNLRAFNAAASTTAILSLLDELDDADDLQRVLNLKTEKIIALNDAVADLSEKLEQYRKDAERMNTAIMFAANALATVTSSDGSGHADLAESALRMAGIPADEREQLVTEWKAKSQWRIDAEMAKEGGANG